MKKTFFLLLIITIIPDVFASTGRNVEYTCPLCNTNFESFTQFSYTTFGMNLDLRPYGAAIIPTPIAKCPHCNFVFFDDYFTKEEINAIKMELETNNIFVNEPDMPNYYYFAKEAEIIDSDLDDIIWWYLSAVWENRNESKKNILIDITIKNIDKLEKTDEAYNDYQMVKLDLLRRSGQFEKALDLIEEIKLNKDYYYDIIVKIINLQTELIKNKDQKEHPIPRDD